MIVVTDTNRSPIIGILAWLLLVISSLAGAARLGIKYAITRRFSMDDYLIFVSLVISFLQTGCISIAVHNGYGTEQSASSDEQIETALKALYAAYLLYIISLSFAKLSALAFMTFLMQRTRKMEWVFTGLIVVWAISAEFALAFQCGFPNPWDLAKHNCFDREAWWLYFGVTNILSEFALIVIPSLLVLHIQMADSKKVVVICCFLTRLSVVGAIIVELVYRDSSKNAEDPLLELWKVAVCIQLIQSFAILAACIPHLKPFMDGLQSTGLRLYYLPGETSRQGDYNYGSRGKTVGHQLSGLAGTAVANSTTVFANRPQPDWNDDNMSQNSQSHIIRETVEWVVEEQYHPEAAENHRASRILEIPSGESHELHDLS
ncbi:hypothetical protein BO70DRAFT_327359 [Aspergillus heteromorphus CBS 117.55]|uniref:Rhodopsin domain-containing protein n=1 Tax=Aspergillus heteromorphus CBS 117.55 TaxID=1448321 RepID=A0A317X6S3_9EURO|nr:uncharacterized protein BO70DRAFT_327359 [Aspergillus heteromorphus CBS 117.55]PWY92270.1 hypothetical protein BO70DRAFT_327359 [Aspergillus heteromorphus CBS 117.55]